jgi:exo-1,4-beta-D-glucosaminidase
MVYLSVRRGDTANSVLPIFWDDNYISLLPGEARTIDGYFDASDLHGKTARLKVSGWNVEH